MGELNEIRQVVILAAGRSRRMEELSNNEPKCLLPYRGERVLERLVRQLKQNHVDNIVIAIGYRSDLMKELFGSNKSVHLVENKMYEEDVNIYSLYLALSQVNEPCAIFEADTIMEDDLVKYVIGSDFEGKSVWFTRGQFNESQYGGILHSDENGNVDDIKIVSAYQDAYKNYTKLTGIMRVGPGEIELFKSLVGKYARTTLKQYFLNAWIENLSVLPCVEADITAYEFFTFNKPEEYYQIQGKEIGYKPVFSEIEIEPVEGLKHIEDFDPDRVERLIGQISESGSWNVPIVVERKTGLILDGQHRIEAAKKLGLRRIPVINVNYEDVAVWSLRKEIPVSVEAVKRYVLEENKIYPYKTVKHKFNFAVNNDLNIALDELR